MGWIEFESLRFFCPDGADVFVGCETFESLEPSGEVVGVDEVDEVLPEVLVCLVVEAFDGSFFESSVHAFDLAVGPGVFGLGQAVVDVADGAGILEGVSAEEFSCSERTSDLGSHRVAIAGRGEVDAVVGEYGVDFVRYGMDQRLKEVGCHALRGLFMHLDEGELRGTIDGHQQVELALFCAHFGDVDVEVADRIGLELLAPRAVALHVWQTRDLVPLQTTVQRRAGQLRDRGLQGVEAIVERQQRMPAKGNDNSFLLKGKNGGLRCRPGLPIRHRRPLPPFGDGLRVDAMPPGQRPQALLTMLYRSTDCLCRAGASV